MKNLFSDPGGELKTFAKIFLIAEVLGLLVLGIFLFAEENIVAGLSLFILGFPCAYVFALSLAAFGDLVENMEMNWLTNREILEKLEKLEQKETEE